uniref:Protein SNA4 n=1 Tax=Haemonchus contortus TaxID=6289 RepID=A0A7I4Y112_HAECO|nr:Uncharacterised protein family UPF0057 domain containing protein [Haemonchus contortus]
MCLLLLEIFCAFVMPPLALLFHSGCTIQFFFNCLLTAFGYIPGVVHALYIIFKKPKKQGVVLTTQVNVAQPMLPMQQPMQPPPATVYYCPPTAPPPPVYYADVAQKY